MCSLFFVVAGAVVSIGGAGNGLVIITRILKIFNSIMHVMQLAPIRFFNQYHSTPPIHLCVFNLQSHTRFSPFPISEREDYSFLYISVVCGFYVDAATAAPVIMCPLYVFCKKKSHELCATAKRTIHCSLATEPWQYNCVSLLCTPSASSLRSWESRFRDSVQ